MDEEFRISERLDAKSRQAFALAAGFFAVVQTVTFGSFAQAEITSTERGVLLTVGLIAGAAVAWVAHRLSGSEELQEEVDVAPDTIIKWLDEANDDPEYLSANLANRLRDVAKSRHATNRIRERNYDDVADATRLALMLAGVELIVALVVRL